MAPMAVRTWTALSPQTQKRFLEIIPGAMTWIVLLIPVIVAFAIRLNDPAYLWILGLGAVLIDLYWFVRTVVTVFWVRRSLHELQRVEGIDWWSECQKLSPQEGIAGPGDITHCALIPTYTEQYEVLQATVAALAGQSYPDHLKVCAIITRTTDTDGWANVERLRGEFGHRFRAFIHIKDPLLPGIVVGKSAAMSYAGPVLRRHCDELGLDPERTLVTDLDSDFRLHPQYFAYITWNFLQSDAPLTSIWQPVPVFLNNLWRVPAAVRVMATVATQWQMFLHQHPDRLVMFSSYTMPMRLLSDVGYWDSDVIPEDSRFFWKAFFHCGAQLHVRPAFLPVFGDAPRSRDYASTHASQYNQIRRWAWGATDVPYVAVRMLSHDEIPRRLRARRFRYLIFNHLTWATLPLLLLFGGLLPTQIDLDYSLSPTATVLSLVAAGILTVTLLNTLVLISVDRAMCPRPPEWSWWHRRYVEIQLFLSPVVGVALSVIPALEAQTRLMFGAYIEYKVTEKGP